MNRINEQPIVLRTSTGTEAHGHLMMVCDDETTPQLFLTPIQAIQQPTAFLIRLHNRAGIPIIEGRVALSPNQGRTQVENARPLGIEAYNHASPEERMRVIQRVWSRVSFATMSLD